MITSEPPCQQPGQTSATQHGRITPRRRTACPTRANPAKCPGPGAGRRRESRARRLVIAAPPALWRWPCLVREHLPALVPVLSRGKHRSPRRGACFMELASYLAGEQWSDDPACTHPLLAALARDVNDHTSDAGRAALARLVPSVIGLAGEDLHIDARIALLCARTALPVAAATTQQVM